MASLSWDRGPEESPKMGLEMLVHCRRSSFDLYVALRPVRPDFCCAWSMGDPIQDDSDQPNNEAHHLIYFRLITAPPKENPKKRTWQSLNDFEHALKSLAAVSQSNAG